jgi:hypothetical protein
MGTTYSQTPILHPAKPTQSEEENIRGRADAQHNGCCRFTILKQLLDEADQTAPSVGANSKEGGVAHFQTGDSICYRKGGPTYSVRSVFADGLLLVSKKNGRTKLLTRPEDYVLIAQDEQLRAGPCLARLTEVTVPRAPEA